MTTALALTAAELDRRIVTEIRGAVSAMWRAGRLLTERQRRMDHGAWLPYLDRIGLPARTAQKAMSLASKYADPAHLPATVEAALEASPVERRRAAVLRYWPGLRHGRRCDPHRGRPLRRGDRVPGGRRATAARRARVDAAIVAVLFCAGLRRAEASALVWEDIEATERPEQLRVRVRTSKTNPTADLDDFRLLVGPFARAVDELRDAVRPSGLERVIPLSPYVRSVPGVFDLAAVVLDFGPLKLLRVLIREGGPADRLGQGHAGRARRDQLCRCGRWLTARRWAGQGLPTSHVRLEPLCMLVCVMPAWTQFSSSFFRGRVGLVVGVDDDSKEESSSTSP